MSEVAEQIAEQVSEVVENNVDAVIEYVDVVRNNPIVLAGAVALGLALGATGGYFVTKKRLAAMYEEQEAEAVEQAKEFYKDFYQKLNKVDEHGDPLSPSQVYREIHNDEDVEALTALQTYQGKPPAVIQGVGETEEQALLAKAVARAAENGHQTETVETTTVTKSTLFAGRDPVTSDEDPYIYELEVANRKINVPYVIMHDEFFQGELGYETISYTYYEGDGALVDEKDRPVEEADKMIGEDNLTRFGHASKDKNIVYVRNDLLELDFEIVRSDGSYTKEVLGFDEPDSLRHSDRRSQRRAFRDQ